MSAFARNLAVTIGRHDLARPGEHILVAVSGGGDSMALLGALGEIAAAWSFSLSVAHLDHGLRGAAGMDDRKFVEEFAVGKGYPVVTETVHLEPGGNIEARAREVRYAFLDRAATKAGCSQIALGHTKTDQAETVLLRLLRGAGTRGLSGMAPRRGRLIRPLLEHSREQARRFLTEHGIPWVEDTTNRDERFTRNRLRHGLLPMLEAFAGRSLVDGLAQTATLLRDEDRLLDDLARHTLDAVGGDPSRNLPGMREVTPGLRRRVLRLWLAAVRGSLAGISRVHIQALERASEQHESNLVVLPGGCVRSEAGILWWETAGPPPAIPFSYVLTPGTSVIRPDLGWELRLSSSVPWPTDRQLPSDRWTAVFDLSELHLPLTLRTVRPGDRIRPIGLGGSQKLQDLFVNEKVPRAGRPLIPVLVAGTEVLWVPGLSRSSIAAISPTTRAVVWAECRRLS